ncbi:MAG: ATP-binding protein, partial [Candidatus Competibacteraceae bacterium]|nr:ATP-binding protein [Candidatus Competibacteraceae bacterium]
MADERALALQVIESLNNDPLCPPGIRLEPVAWDRPGGGPPLDTWLSPQEAINRRMPLPSQCQILVCILWTRIGTPLPQDSELTDTDPPLTGTQWEFRDAMNADPRPLALTYRCLREFRLPPTATDKRKRIEQMEGVDAFFAGFRDQQGVHRLSKMIYTEPGEFKTKLEHHLRAFLKELADTDGYAQDSRGRRREINPYPGFQAFRRDQAEFFFGRERQTDQLIRKLRDSRARFVSVIGPSGSGKSSLVWAGLLPRLEQGAISKVRDWRVLACRPTDFDDPFQSLAFAGARLLEPSPWRPRDKAQALAAAPVALGGLVEDVLAHRPDSAECLLFVDQFEELFTQVEQRHRGPFLDLLAHSRKIDRLRIVITMRSEFAGRFGQWPQLADLLNADGTLWLTAPGHLQLEQMIRRPAER